MTTPDPSPVGVPDPASVGAPVPAAVPAPAPVPAPSPVGGSLPALRTLLVVDVQNDFCEGGALAVTGGAAVAERIADFLEDRAGEYRRVVLSRDWHEPSGTNGGHFALPPGEPDYLDSWPPHCVQGTPGADYHPAIIRALAELEERGIEVVHVVKGEGVPAYSLAEGRIERVAASADGNAPTPSDSSSLPDSPGLPDSPSLPGSLTVPDLLVGPIDVVGLAFDYCVAASAKDAARANPVGPVRVLLDLTAAVHSEADPETVAQLAAAGITVADSDDPPGDGPGGYAAPTADLLDPLEVAPGVSASSPKES